MADLMVKLERDRVPGPVMDVLQRHGGLMELMRVCEDAGLHVTVVISPAGSEITKVELKGVPP